MNRRDFIKLTAVGAGAALNSSPLLSGQTAPAAQPRTMVGMPISAAPLAAPNFDRQLADMRQRGGVNTLFHSSTRTRAIGPAWRPALSGAATMRSRTWSSIRTRS